MIRHSSSASAFYIRNREQSVRNMARLRRLLQSEPMEMVAHAGISDRCFVLRSGRGEIVVGDPMDENFGLARHPPETGLARLSCSFDHHTFYYTEVVVQSVEELREMIQLHRLLETVQERANTTVYVPREYRRHRFLPAYQNRTHHGWSFVAV